MSKYLKKFETQAAYEAAQSGLILPNVSLIVETNGVAYNPWVETRLVGKFNVTNTSSPTKITDRITNFTSIEIDGVVQPSVVSAYTFSTLGEHTIKYTLTDSTTMGDYTFFYCDKLVSADIPYTVTNIGTSAFYSATSLTSIVIPDGVTSIGDNAFSRCSGLTSINVPDSVTTIGSRGFNNCGNVSTVTIGSGITSIGGYAFTDVEGIITINALTPPTLGDDVFSDNQNLTIYVPAESVDTYKSATKWSTYASRIQAIQ